MSAPVRLILPARYKYLSVIGACTAAFLQRVDGIANLDTLIYNMQLALQEACTNIIAHAYGVEGDDPIEVSFSLEQHPKRILVEIRDRGTAFDPSKVPEPDLDSAQVHGYGLFLMRQLTDEMSYSSEHGANRLRLVKNL